MKPARVVYADPPWPETGQVSPMSGANKKAGMPSYNLMTLEEIKNIQLPPRTKKGWLFLWCPWRKIDEGFEVLNAWGYKYSGAGFIWVKTNKHDPVTKLLKFLNQTRNKEAKSLIPEKYLIALEEVGGEIVPCCGMGYYNRVAHEVLLVGKIGTPGPPNNRSTKSVISAPREGHSVKPEKFAKMIEEYSDGPYVELFARRTRPGWECLGDELGDVL